MAQGVNATKTGARPSHEAIENKPGSVTNVGKTEEEKMDKVAMEGAKRASNRIHSNEETTPNNTIFSK
jgi:hypothetical protein